MFTRRLLSSCIQDRIYSMSIKKTTKMMRFAVFASLSVLVTFLAFVLHKNQKESQAVLLDRDTNVVHADVPVTPSDGSGSGDGNDADSGGSGY